MATNTELLTQTIPNLLELCNTIQEAAKHAQEQPDSAPAMKADIAAGIEAVQAAACGICVEGALEFTPTDVSKMLKKKQLYDGVNGWFVDSIGPFLMQRFHRALLEEQQFTQQDAQTIAHWILGKMPVGAEKKRALLLELGIRCAAWAPEFSWNLMRQVLDTMPPEEQKETFPHWAGAPYRPGLHPQTELKCCPTCGGKGTPYHAALSGRMNNFDTLFLPAKLWMRCECCGNLYTRYFPTEFLQLGAAPHVLQPTPQHMVTRQVTANSLHIWSDILNKIRAHTSDKTLLEVGVGQGHLIAVAQEMGYDVTAVELLESEAQQTADLLGLPVICGDFLHMEEDKQVGIITMGDVIEHLQRPMEGLRKAHALLKDGGILWLSTPNYESSFTRMLKAFDAMWCEPYHISYFSREGLLKLLDQVGFDLLEYTVSNRYNGSMELLLKKR